MWSCGAASVPSACRRASLQIAFESRGLREVPSVSGTTEHPDSGGVAVGYRSHGFSHPAAYGLCLHSFKGGTQFALPGTPGDEACLEKGSFLSVKSRFKEVARRAEGETIVVGEVCELLERG